MASLAARAGTRPRAPPRPQLPAPRREQRQHVSGRGGGRGRPSAPPLPELFHPPELGCAVRPRLSHGRAVAGGAAPRGRRAVWEGGGPAGRGGAGRCREYKVSELIRHKSCWVCQAPFISSLLPQKELSQADRFPQNRQGSIPRPPSLGDPERAPPLPPSTQVPPPDTWGVRAPCETHCLTQEPLATCGFRARQMWLV